MLLIRKERSREIGLPITPARTGTCCTAADEGAEKELSESEDVQPGEIHISVIGHTHLD